MIKALVLEYYKLRRRKVWVMLTLFLAAELGWASMSMSISISRSAENATWEALIFSISSMNGLFLPILSAIVVSRICDMEHKGDTWKMLMTTPISRNRIYAAKYICASSLILYGIFGQVVFIVGFGLSRNVAGTVPVVLLLQFMAGTLLANLMIAALQQWLSLAVKNQAFALGLGMLGGFLGTTASLFPPAVRHGFIWSYYMDLSPVTYVYAASAGTYITGTMPLGLLSVALALTLIFYISGQTYVSRQEI
ncbi:multidrug ABC transporter permease [Paenibacillus albidus]|uniref:Multidrug ABC transporter permease n=1 Tax=Paenibacillus albidus TaxID=2041023 RepID=A0A917CZG3_9BACL|nr:ABC transporter permease [Paenibacillus albidus]GGG02941.1 multidrug ABC transporter permease [Paenibacillus albidus]